MRASYPALLSAFLVLNTSEGFISHVRSTFQRSSNTRLRESLPSWKELEERISNSPVGSTSPAQLTLYRDTNGWCPFCERVWLALEIKGISYKESLINLQNKPDWYLDMVPTGLTPAVMIYDELLTSNNQNEDEGGTFVPPQRTVIWESEDILQALDDLFPETQRLMLDTPEYKAADKLIEELTAAGFGYIYAGRNETLTEQDKLEKKKRFEEYLNEMDALIGSHGGNSFILGQDISGIDVKIIPAMERWRYQMYLTTELDLFENRPNIQKWFEETMDKYGPYANRVVGDKYSWTAVSSFFLKAFAAKDENGNPTPETMEKIQRSDDAAKSLIDGFTSPSSLYYSSLSDEEVKLRAVLKIVSNHENILADCTNVDPKSQKDIPRATSSESADIALRAVVQKLLEVSSNQKKEILPKEITAPEFANREDAIEASLAMKTIAQRLCVPRDMGAPSAAILRSALMSMAEQIESDQKSSLKSKKDQIAA